MFLAENATRDRSRLKIRTKEEYKVIREKSVVREGKRRKGREREEREEGNGQRKRRWGREEN